MLTQKNLVCLANKLPQAMAELLKKYDLKELYLAQPHPSAKIERLVFFISRDESYDFDPISTSAQVCSELYKLMEGETPFPSDELHVSCLESYREGTIPETYAEISPLSGGYYR